MLRYILCFFCVVLIAVLIGIHPADANSYGSLYTYGYPLIFGQGGDNGMGVPGGSYTVSNPGLGVSGVTSTYGILGASAASVSPQQPYYGYVGPSLNGISLGVNFGYPTATHDATTTSYAKDLAYEASLDNAFIGFPGVGVGSLGVGFPSVSTNKADIKYMESVKFQISTESDTMPLGGFGFPLGLGLGYTNVGMTGSTGMAYGGLGMPFYYGSGA